MGGQRLIVSALAALLPPLATAQEQGGSGACRADVQKYCASAGNKKECMLDHQNDVTDACYSFMKSMVLRERAAGAQKQESADSYEPVGSPIYKVRTAEGRIVYTNAPVTNGTEVKDRNNIALPIR